MRKKISTRLAYSTRLLEKARVCAKDQPTLTVCYLQRKLNIGYVLAVEIYNKLASEGLVQKRKS